MKFDILAVFLCMTIATTIGSDEHRPKLKVKDDARGKRNLEYQISHHYPIGANFRLERRISNGPLNYQLNSRFPTYFSGPRPHIHRGHPHSIPPYAVQMEPLVQYSQRDPLYDTSKLPLSAEGHNDLSKPSDDLLTDNNHLSENIYSHNVHGPPYGHHQNEPPVYYQKEPEPIIEIIIKESNVTLPPVPVPTIPPKKKEPVQVFYVKYKKNPNGYGKDSVIYEKPVPALTPHVHDEEHEEPQLDQPHQEYVTLPPPPSTTLRTIIRPDSETYIGTSGIHVTFGSEDKKHKSSPEGHEESAPQPAVAFPQAQTPQQLPHKNHNNNNNQHHHHHQIQQQHHHQQHHQQPQPQFSQPIPERKPPTSAFPPNFNPPINFNQQSFGSRPVPNQPPQFANTQYRPVHQQPARPFPAASQNQQQRAPIPPQRSYQQQQQGFSHQRPISPPQLPTLPSLQRPSFNPPPQFPPNHFNPNHQTPPFTLNQFPPNQQFHFNNQQFPPQTQFPGFSQQHFPQQSTKQQFAQILNQRPQTHFPIVQQPPFNHKPQSQNEQFKHNQQQSQQLRVNQHQQQQQNFQFHNQNRPNTNQQTQIQHHPQQHQQPQHQSQQHQQQQHQQQQQQQQHQPQQHQPQQHQPQQHQPQQHQPQHQSHQQQHHQQQQHQQQQQQHQQQQQQQHQQQQHLQQLQQSTPHIIPPGGELLKSVPKYEQHISIPAEPTPQIHNSQGISSQALPLQSQSSINQNVAAPGAQNHHQLSQQSNHKNFQQLQSQLQQQINQQQQQFNQQLQQQIKQDQLLLQQQSLSPIDFRQQIQQQFQFPLQDFAQLNNVQNLQNKQVNPTTSPPKQENIFVQQSNSQRSQTPQNYFNVQQQESSFYQSHNSIPNIYQTSSTPSAPSSTSAPKIIYQSTISTTTSTTSKPIEKTEDKKNNKLPPNIQLPDEVPDDLREQLLSSGILSNADISVLDYDKIGDIPIDALPPDQLANFYGAGGAQQLAASERKETFLKPDGSPIDSKDSMVNIDEELSAEESQIDEVKTFEPSKQPEMKVVRYDSQSEQGQSVQNSYVRDDATHVDPVVLNDNKYNRYLPLKVSGAQFPIPDVPELKGRNITSVVVLAPVDYEFHQHNKNERSARDIEGDIKDVKLRTVDALKELLKKPTKENYKKWLEKEKETEADKQSVILLVTGSQDDKDKEIFMYDVTSKTVSKLSGELSSAFVEAAESNASDDIPEASQVYESRIDVDKSDLTVESMNRRS